MSIYALLIAFWFSRIIYLPLSHFHHTYFPTSTLDWIFHCLSRHCYPSVIPFVSPTFSYFLITAIFLLGLQFVLIFKLKAYPIFKQKLNSHTTSWSFLPIAFLPTRFIEIVVHSHCLHLINPFLFTPFLHQTTLAPCFPISKFKLGFYSLSNCPICNPVDYCKPFPPIQYSTLGSVALTILSFYLYLLFLDVI